MAKVTQTNSTSEYNPIIEPKDDKIDDNILLGKVKNEDGKSSYSNASGNSASEERAEYLSGRSKNNYIYNVLKETDNELKRVE